MTGKSWAEQGPDSSETWPLHYLGREGQKARCGERGAGLQLQAPRPENSRARAGSQGGSLVKVATEEINEITGTCFETVDYWF